MNITSKCSLVFCVAIGSHPLHTNYSTIWLVMDPAHISLLQTCFERIEGILEKYNDMVNAFWTEIRQSIDARAQAITAFAIQLQQLL